MAQLLTPKQRKEFTVNPQDVKRAKSEVVKSDLSLDDKILALTALKAELLLHLQARGHKFKTH